jgi:PadR family transcriptional regulator, regulatory protein PadR
MPSEFFLGFIKIHILYHASKGVVYGVELMEELHRHGYKVSPGTIYPTLHKLEKEGLLESTQELIQGRFRRYYRITRQGQIALEDARSKVRELFREIIEEKS